MNYRFTFVSEHYADRKTDVGLEMPEGHRGPVPLGHALTIELIKALEARRWEVPFRWATDYGHAFEARGGGYRLDVVVSCRDAEAGRWELSAERRSGLIPWLRDRDPAMLRELARDLWAALAADPVVSEVRPTDSAQAEALGPPPVIHQTEDSSEEP